jgi:hypothetical protein
VAASARNVSRSDPYTNESRSLHSQSIPSSAASARIHSSAVSWPSPYARAVSSSKRPHRSA